MSFDPALAVAAFGIGIVVGLTGMGGGALMTPVLVLFFDVLPLTAVSSDLSRRRPRRLVLVRKMLRFHR